MNGAELLAAALENEGAKQIFGMPGEENLDIVEALRRSTIELVVTRHDQAAAFMAATHGRLTGEPGVCLSTLGPGALNLATGTAYALDNVIGDLADLECGKSMRQACQGSIGNRDCPSLGLSRGASPHRNHPGGRQPSFARC